jgi:hypothetical protein
MPFDYIKVRKSEEGFRDMLEMIERHQQEGKIESYFVLDGDELILYLNNSSPSLVQSVLQ